MVTFAETGSVTRFAAVAGLQVIQVELAHGDVKYLLAGFLTFLLTHSALEALVIMPDMLYTHLRQAEVPAQRGEWVFFWFSVLLQNW